MRSKTWEGDAKNENVGVSRPGIWVKVLEWGAMWRVICPLRDRKCDYYLLRAKSVRTGCKRVKMALTHARTA